jgi:hypothetical protein
MNRKRTILPQGFTSADVCFMVIQPLSPESVRMCHREMQSADSRLAKDRWATASQNQAGTFDA